MKPSFWRSVIVQMGWALVLLFAVTPTTQAETPPSEPGYIVITTVPDPGWIGIGAFSRFNFFYRVYSPTPDGLIVAQFDKPGRYKVRYIDTLAPGADRASKAPAKRNYEVDGLIDFDVLPGKVIYIGNFTYNHEDCRNLFGIKQPCRDVHFGFTKKPEDIILAKRLLDVHRPELTSRLETPSN